MRVARLPGMNETARKRAPAKKPRKSYKRTFVREWREFRGLSQEQLAERIGLQAPALSYLERGQSAYTQGTMERLAVALDTTVPALLTVDPANQDDIGELLRKEGEVVGLLRRIDDSNRAQAIRVLKALTNLN